MYSIDVNEVKFESKYKENTSKLPLNKSKYSSDCKLKRVEKCNNIKILWKKSQKENKKCVVM